ncbi:Galactosyl transferase [Drechmeria coniospora]|uniref:Galactosyl transferase n=1 Tax=Drechmeria coniospora TaxID=98403 RepID=A0A151GN30_DRECN|nr:Galactosyl transferase [Drechmeria coniospora]KYK58513.1 Galactosyl transferase [Drechmeria coniospora]ODA83840.1 hypothetical protein RJ55_02356 [Drechmeria coniospora]
MIFGGSARTSRGTAIAAFVAVCVVVTLGLDALRNLHLWRQGYRVRLSSSGLHAHAPFSEGTAGQYAGELREFYLKQLRNPSIKPDDNNYQPFGAFNWTLPAPPHWKRHLGENLCIIDLDNRPFNQSQELFGPDLMTWKRATEVHGLSTGILNHWLYAKLHGYRYYYVAIDDYADRRSSWKKPPVMGRILKEHDVCIYLDSDAIFQRLDLPMEWLLNYWQLYPDNNSLGLARDPEVDGNKDQFGNIYLNTGFIVAQNNPKTYEIFNAWQKCADDGEPYPECTKYRLNAPGQPTDQGGFGNYVRYSFNESIRVLPCTEANGFPETDLHCKGQFIRHLWTGKHDQIKIEVGGQLPGPFLEMFHEQFRREKDTFYMTERDLMNKGPKAATKRKPRGE